jgi:dihydroceramidase
MKIARPLLIALLISAVTLGALTSLPASAWTNWRPATCLQQGCFCERPNQNSPIRQTANTLSSLGYIFSGTLAMIPFNNARRFSRGHAFVFGAASLLIGVGSGQFFDVLGMFMLATLMLVYAFERIRNLRFTATIRLYLVIVLFLSVLQISLPDTRRFVFALALIIALFFEARYLKQQTPIIDVNKLRLGIILLAVAYLIWILDNARIVCFETSLMQGHALWHLLGAASVWLLYQYYASEVKQRS